jgi:CRISPR-associated helicase Cas3
LKIDKDYLAFQLSFYLRILFSVLVDSDFTDTEEFRTGIKRDNQHSTIDKLNARFMANMPKNKSGEINSIRAEVLNSCIAAAPRKQGLFSLTVPTGGGKTLSSLAFALKHAQTHGLRRIIYVIPYTSIIEQNAAVFKEKLGNDNVLEHHSNFDIKDRDFDNPFASLQTKWASENWDIPVVVTTNVQFFESLFAAKTTKARKIHNIANSVVIFDEAQMLPTDYLSPCMAAISELIANYGVTVLLCSATQPLVQKYAYLGMDTTEIINNPDDLAVRLKRVDYLYLGPKTDEELVGLLSGLHSALVIVSSRKHAFTLYQLARETVAKGKLVYLSTLVTPVDRTAKIAEIKRRLKNKEPVIVISTQLIEAGVDVDFPVVYRSLTGIDSIVQAGGRANREGKLSQPGVVYIFEPTDSPIPPALRLTASIGRILINCLGARAFTLEGIKKYFELFYDALERGGTLDKQGILSEFEENRGKIVKMNFKTAAEKFKLIGDDTKTVIIPCEENDASIKQIRNGYATRATLRALQGYGINVYNNEFERLRENNAIMTIDDIHILVSPKYYVYETGFDIFTDENKNAECVFV